MKKHILKVSTSNESLPKKEQLAWKLASMVLSTASISKEVEGEVVSRIIDNAAVATASLKRPAVAHARDQAISHFRKNGATVFGLNSKYCFSAEWSAWANGVAVRELDFHDTFLAADYSHPADSIPPILAVAEQTGKNGKEVLEAIVAAYETHISLVKGICLHKHKVDHIAHLAPAQVAGLGVLLSMEQETLYQAIGQAVHLSFTTRQSRKGEISTWKAYAPAFSGKIAIESVDRALRGESSPSPIYEGEDSVVAWFLDGPDAFYEVPLTEEGEEKRMILESYTKAHSAEYQAQAFIDLAFEMKSLVKDVSQIKKIVLKTSHHTHYVIGTGSNDPEKFDPKASRETLDHSLMYIFAVALQDGKWHHIHSYSSKRANREDTVSLWRKIKTREEKYWTEKYHHPNPNKKAFGGEAEIYFSDGSVIKGRKELADAHPFGKHPFKRENYIQKFKDLTEGIITKKESERFLDSVQRLSKLKSGEISQLNIQAGLSPESQSQGLF